MLHFGWGQPGRILPVLAGLGPPPGGDGVRDEIQCLSLATRSYGYRRITAQLRQLGFAMNHKRVQRLRTKDNLLCLRKPAFRPVTTQSDHRFKVWPNLARTLLPMAVNQLYLAVILDAFSRRVIGWALSERLTAEFALDALAMALSTREVIPGGLVHHSDRGVQYACGDYIARLQQAGIQPSMSRPGCPWDNAMAESFMRTLKQEEVDGQSYRDLADARSRIGAFLEEVYNHQRLHSALAYQAPAVFEMAIPIGLAKADA
jgi:putative transposase